MSMLLARQYRPAYTQCVIGKVLTKKVQFQTFKKPSMIMFWKISIKNLLKFHFFSLIQNTVAWLGALEVVNSII